MSDDEFEDILDQVYTHRPLIVHDPYARDLYDAAIAKVLNTGGEEQRARLQDLLGEMEEEEEAEEEARQEAERDQEDQEEDEKQDAE